MSPRATTPDTAETLPKFADVFIFSPSIIQTTVVPQTSLISYSEAVGACRKKTSPAENEGW